MIASLLDLLLQCFYKLLLGCVYVIFGAPIVVQGCFLIHLIYSAFTGGL